MAIFQNVIYPGKKLNETGARLLYFSAFFSPFPLSPSPNTAGACNCQVLVKNEVTEVIIYRIPDMQVLCVYALDRLEENTVKTISSFLSSLLKCINIPELSIDILRPIEENEGDAIEVSKKEYLKSIYGNVCQYCNGASGDASLELEHIISKKNKGPNRISNLTLACHTCNHEKGELNLCNWYETIKEKTEKDYLDYARIDAIKKFMKKYMENKPIRYYGVTDYAIMCINQIRKRSGKKITEITTAKKKNAMHAVYRVAKEGGKEGGRILGYVTVCNGMNRGVYVYTSKEEKKDLFRAYGGHGISLREKMGRENITHACEYITERGFIIDED